MADNQPAVLGGTAIKPKERHGWEAVRYLIHNPETGEFFTRTPKSWAMITGFYIVYYAFLAAFWAAMLMIFFQTLNDQSPRWLNAESLIGTSPGLGMHPKQTDALIDSSMIQYQKGVEADNGDVAGYGGWVSRTKSFLDLYSAQGKSCAPGNGVSKTEFCNFDVASLGPCGKDGYGYADGKPCIYLKLNRIYGLDNTVYSDPENLPEDMPEELKKHIKTASNKDQVWVECHGEYPADRENLGQIKYYPADRGFPSYYFPYENQDGYQSPVVAVQFPDLKANQLYHVECRAWAANIGYDRRDRIGLAHLEIHILDEDGAKAVGQS